MIDFILNNKPSEETFKKYEPLLPENLISFWKQYGFGSFNQNYLKSANPEDYEKLLAEWYSPIDKKPLVMFTTSMADLIVWEGGYTVLLNFRKNESKVIESGFKYFLEDVNEKDFLKEEMEFNPYLKAKEKLGEPAFDECFGYEPILAAGGSEKIQNLRKVKLIEHINIIVQFTGKI